VKFKQKVVEKGQLNFTSQIWPFHGFRVRSENWFSYQKWLKINKIGWKNSVDFHPQFPIQLILIDTLLTFTMLQDVTLGKTTTSHMTLLCHSWPTYKNTWFIWQLERGHWFSWGGGCAPTKDKQALHDRSWLLTKHEQLWRQDWHRSTEGIYMQ
jgi:hypothetical protein